MFELRRVLVPTDFSGPSRRAFDYAVFLARKFEVPITLLHVWDTPVMLSGDAALWGPGVDPTLYERTLEKDAREQMRTFEGEVDSRGCTVDTRIERGHPGETITRLAEREAFDLIVMGTRGRGALGRLFLGSVATYVVAKASCPVVTVRLHGG